MVYEFDDLDLALIAKCREALEFLHNGDPMRDVLDSDDYEDAIKLLVAIVDAQEVGK